MDKIKIIIEDNQKKVKIPTGTRMLIRRACNAVLIMEDFEGSAEVSVQFVDDNMIREMNKKFRNKDIDTDVLSFPLGENGNYDINHSTGAKLLGDIVISMEHVIEQAERFGHSFQREVAYLTTHSMLHLLGYDHMEKIELMRMREKEEYIMNLLGLARDASYVDAEDPLTFK